ncbi:hypothetical protein RTBOTA2_005347 [Rhodotorula toruloides]|uniref:Uncharacterized protein n=1 Tax=Rhodotorula toruloides TaxID=5286 RepID=A0A0K3CLW4_RHOTO|nr:hypothetical protein RTBOTA2_005347 [Rhodotorula toruloides]
MSTSHQQTEQQEQHKAVGHHRFHGHSDAREAPKTDCMRMHQEEARDAEQKLAHDEVHDFIGQPNDQLERARNVLKDPNSPPDAKLNALDNAEALPHGGYLVGDL